MLFGEYYKVLFIFCDDVFFINWVLVVYVFYDIL